MFVHLPALLDAIAVGILVVGTRLSNERIFDAGESM